MDGTTTADPNEHHHGDTADRLSSLPDILLSEILSLLPIDAAAATSVLSRRWRHVWTQVSRISFNCPRFQSHNTVSDWETRCSNHLTSVDQTLRQLTSPKIRSFELDISCPRMAQFQRLRALASPWLTQIFARNPERVKLRFSYFELGSRDRLIPVPGCVFRSDSLVTLKLGESNLDYPAPEDGGPPCLPNLKQLTFSIRDSHLEFMSAVLGSCPLLEDLSLGAHLEDDERPLEIRSRNLRRLRLHLYGPDGHDRCVDYVIDAPKLEHIKADSTCFASYHFVKRPRGLITAELLVGDSKAGPSAYDHLDRAEDLAHNVSRVRVLKLCGTMFSSLYGLEEDDQLPIFPNLVELYLDAWGNLLPFLRCSPKLETLLLYMVYEDPVIAEETEYWDVPTCLATRLKKMTVGGLNATDDELRFLAYVLRNARFLESLVLSTDTMTKRELAKEFEFSKKLFSYPRSSLDCEIHFRGAYLKASSRDFKKGILDCQICFSGEAFLDLGSSPPSTTPSPW